jgi:hypothetical protein
MVRRGPTTHNRHPAFISVNSAATSGRIVQANVRDDV